jgi:hypothetical protein
MAADLFDTGMHIFETWAQGSAWQARWLGPFNHSMTAREAWRLRDFEGNLSPSSFDKFERGWTTAAAAYAQRQAVHSV